MAEKNIEKKTVKKKTEKENKTVKKEMLNKKTVEKETKKAVATPKADQTKKVEETKKADVAPTKEETAQKTKDTSKTVENKKVDQKKVVKEKTKAVARGVSLRISPKYAVAICKMIKGKTPQVAKDMLAEVTRGKRAVPMNALEVPHQKGKGVAGAKFPKNAAREIRRVVEQVQANAVVNGIENAMLSLCKADRATAPFRSGGRRAKRAHILLEVQDRTRLTKGAGN